MFFVCFLFPLEGLKGFILKGGGNEQVFRRRN